MLIYGWLIFAFWLVLIAIWVISARRLLHTRISTRTWRREIALRLGAFAVVALHGNFPLTWSGQRCCCRGFCEIAEMVGTVQDAMREVLDCWRDLPTPMREAVEQFRIELGAAIDSVEFVKKALDREVHGTN